MRTFLFVLKAQYSKLYSSSLSPFSYSSTSSTSYHCHLQYQCNYRHHYYHQRQPNHFHLQQVLIVILLHHFPSSVYSMIYLSISISITLFTNIHDFSSTAASIFSSPTQSLSKHITHQLITNLKYAFLVEVILMKNYLKVSSKSALYIFFFNQYIFLWISYSILSTWLLIYSFYG